jgi:ABC-2 type transport system ATP-binding protein
MLELAGLTRHYGSVVALDGLSLTVPKGQLYGLLGPNGAGKTTALQIIMGVRRADGGQILWNGRPVTQAIRRVFGYLPEERGLYPRMRVRDHLVYLARLHGVAKDRAQALSDRWLERLEVSGRAGSRIEELSSGNQQRVQLAAALVHEPELLILDEPFSGLDPIAVRELAAVMGEIAEEGRGVIFSSHQLDLVEGMCESVAIVDRGRVVLEGRVEELRSAGPRRLRVEGPASFAWLGTVAGAEVVVEYPTGALVQLEEGTDEQEVLRRAMANGPVTHFGSAPPRLSELFRQAVGR